MSCDEVEFQTTEMRLKTNADDVAVTDGETIESFFDGEVISTATRSSITTESASGTVMILPPLVFSPRDRREFSLIST